MEITPQERAKLSKETLMHWYVKENNVKLKALRKEIGEALKTGAKSKIEKLKAVIISNTKEELKKQKGLTEAQRNTKAKAFAEKFIKYAKENKNFGDVFFTSRFEPGAESVKKSGDKKAELLNQWVNNNPKGDVEFIQDDPKYLALKEIHNQEDRSRAFILLGLIEKFHGGKEVAMKLYKKARKGNKIDLDVLREQFSKEKANSTVGFYYGTRKIVWNYDAWTTEYKMRKRIDKVGFKNEHTTDKKVSFARNAKLVHVKGWWSWDYDEDNKNYINGGYYVEKDFLKKLRGPGYGDEWMGKDINTALTGKRNNLLKELYRADQNVSAGKRDSGLSRDKEGEVRQALVDLMKVPGNVYESTAKTKVLLWFKKHSNEWATLDKNIHGLMQFLFGQGVGLFKYRYVREKKKIFFIRIQDAPIDSSWGIGGEIDIKDGKIVRKWHSYGMEETKEMLKEEIIDDMSDKDIKKEIATNKVNAKEGTRLEKLNATDRIVYKLKKKLPKNVEYNRLKEGYIDKLEKRLKAYLLKHGYKNKEELAGELATIRAEHVQKGVIKFIEDDSVLNKAIEDNDKEKLTISIDTNDELKVDLFDKKKLSKLKNWAKQKAEGAKTTAGDIAESTMARFEKKLEKWLKPFGLGFLAPVAVWVLDKVFKIGDVFKKMARGGTSLFGGLLTSVLGVKVLKDRLKSKKITEEIIEKLPPKKKQFYKFDKKMYFAENVQLKGKKIVIPSGKGIKPGKEFDVNVKGVRDKITIKPIEEKKGLLGRIFGSRRKEKYRLQESEIIISKGTTIPKGTVIPKGAKIYKA